MRKISVVLAVVAAMAAACGSKKDKDAGGGGGGSAGSAAAVKPLACPPGNAAKDGACVVVVTPEKVAVVAQQQTRIEELAKLLEKIDSVSAPIELLNGLRQLDQWKLVIGKNDKLKVIDATVGTLDDAVKKLRVFKGSLSEASGRLANLQGELDRLLKDTGATKRIEEVRALVSSQLRSALEPLAASVADTIQNAITPLATRLGDASDLVIAGCLAVKVTGGGDKALEMCKQAKELFAVATRYVEDVKTKPAALFQEVASKLEHELEALVDDQSKKLIAAAQTAVQDALRMPMTPIQVAPPAAGSGSAGSGSAKP